MIIFLYTFPLTLGASIPLGDLGHANRYHRYSYQSDYNEFVVYKENQVCLRYLIQCKGESQQDTSQEDNDDYSFKDYGTVKSNRKFLSFLPQSWNLTNATEDGLYGHLGPFHKDSPILGLVLRAFKT